MMTIIPRLYTKIHKMTDEKKDIYVVGRIIVVPVVTMVTLSRVRTKALKVVKVLY